MINEKPADRSYIERHFQQSNISRWLGIYPFVVITCSGNLFQYSFFAEVKIGKANVS